jgi:DNA-binding NarL/FixJ family response regulator
VVELLVEGLSNPKIGERLFVSAGTVKTHLAHVYAKLGLANRTEVASAYVQRTAGRAGAAP